MEDREYQRTRKTRDGGPPSNTDTDTRASVAKPKAQSFELYPRAVVEAKKAGELNYNEFAVLLYIIGDTNWQSRNWKGSLSALDGNLEWPHTDEALRKTLLSLREKEWIEYEIGQGQKHYTITLGRQVHDALYEPTSNLPPTSTPPQTSKSLPTDTATEWASSPYVNGRTDVLKPPTTPTPYTETIRDGDGEVVIEERGTGGSLP